MDKEKILKIANDIRKQSLISYYWQVFWASIFLLLVIVSSVFLGLRSPDFWIYIIMPLLVLGGFWVFLQTTRENIKVRLKQRIINLLVENYFEDFKFYPSFKLNKQEFISAHILPDVYTLSSRNALMGEVKGYPVMFCYIKVDKNSERGVITTHSGVFVKVDFGKTVPEFGIYPADEDVSPIAEVLQFKRLSTKLDNNFQVWAKDTQAYDVIERLGPDVMKYAHLCTNPSHFYFTTYNGKLNFSFLDYRDLMEFPLKQSIGADVIDVQVDRLRQCIKFISKVIENLED